MQRRTRRRNRKTVSRSASGWGSRSEPGLGLTVFDNLALGMGLGLSIGLAIGVAVDHRKGE